MKRILLVLLVCAFGVANATAAIQADLLAAMQQSSGQLSIIIIMQQQTDTGSMLRSVRGMTPDVRRAYAVQEMQSLAAATQQPLLDVLHGMESTGDVSDIGSLWIVNAVTCHANAGAIRIISDMDGVGDIVYSTERQLLDPDEWADAYPVSGGARTIAWNVSTVDADEVWDEGYTGEGVLVAVLDSGVNYNHVDLADHMWDGGESYPYHGYDFCNNDDNPMDDHGHGTHCAGTVAGDGTAGTHTGVAPDATIMAVKVVDSDGFGEEDEIWEAIQFAVDHEARVISMSLGWVYDSNPSRAGWRQAMDNAMAAGVVAAVSAGNEGDELDTYPIPHNLRTPGDCPPPWTHPDQTLTGGHSAVISVGATNFSDDVAYFSSRGPCEWGTVGAYADYPYAQGGLIKPDIAAPGVDITSLDYSSNTGYASGWNGTSMAAPCVAGAIALMLQHNPYMTPEVIDQVLEENAMALSEEKDNETGSGLVNAYDAWNNTPSAEVPPSQAKAPSPADGCTHVYRQTYLNWADGFGTPATGYHVYLGTDNPPTNLVNGEATTNTYYQVPLLNANTQYRWRIDPVNEWGETQGAVWTFTTGSGADESFESGGFAAYEWVNDTDHPWTIDTQHALEGSFCARAGDVLDASSTRSLTVNLPEADTLYFYVKTSCEGATDADELRFYVNGTEKAAWHGETQWTLFAQPLSGGQKTLTWQFYRNETGGGGDDTAWLDFISFPNLIFPPRNFAAQVEDINNIRFTWDAPTGTDGLIGYRLYNISMLYAELSDPTATEWLLEDVPDNNYLFTFSAVYTQGEAYYDGSVEVCVWTPNPPRNLTGALTGSGEVTLHWQRPQDNNLHDLTGYKVYRDSAEVAEIDNPATLSWVDGGVSAGSRVYTVTALWGNLESEPSNAVTVNVLSLAGDTVPQRTALVGCSPNPFNPDTKVRYDLATPARVRLEVYNILGQKVNTLVDANQPAGRYSAVWRGTDSSGRAVASGLYFFRLQAGSASFVQKALLLK